jgi:Na+-transporting methylmalonyl-CoA/oxaloacetate decarboxylase gamma subunit
MAVDIPWWLISLELVKWAAAIVALAGMAFVFFWLFIFVTMTITAIIGMFAD